MFVESILENRVRLLPAALSPFLPRGLEEEIGATLPEGVLPEEVRLRRERVASVSACGKNYRLGVCLSGREMDELLLLMCKGSLYAHGETLKKGFLVLDNGLRVGVAGRGNAPAGRLESVSEIGTLVIRIPHPAPMGTGWEIASLLRKDKRGGVLILAPPAGGKTTLLRGVTALLSGGDAPLRVAVVDTRGELGFSLSAPSLLVDILSGYPRGEGISIAARTLSPEVIVLDEIGDVCEAKEIVAASACGVPLLASAHAETLSEWLARPCGKILHCARCFGTYVLPERVAGRFAFSFETVKWGEAGAYL